MTEHQFDELFRNKLKDHSSQVPENFWQRIEPKKDKDRKLFILWFKYFVAPTFIVAGLAGGYYLGTRPAASHSHRATAAHPQVVSTYPAAPVNPEVTSTYSASPANPEVMSTYPAAPVNRQAHPASPANHHAHPASPSAHSPADPLSASASRSAVAHTPNTTPASVHPGSPATPVNRQALTGSLKRQPLPDIQHIPNTLHHPAFDLVLKTTPGPIKRMTALPPAPAPSKNGLSPLKKGAWSIDLYASPDLPVLQIKQDYEKTQLSFTVGLKVNRSFGEHASATTGVQYSQINEKVTYNDSNIVNPLRHAYLKRTSFDLPLLISYGIGDDRFRATLNAGMIFKIHSFGNVYTTGKSIYLGLNLAKKINDKISIFAEPYYRYSLPGSPNSQYYIHRINLAGLSVGLRYNFKRSGKHKQYDTNN